MKRRYKNSLLGYKGTITQDMVNEMQRKDAAELNSFKSEFTGLLDRATALEPNTDSETILKLKEDLDRLYEQCAGLAGKSSKFREGIAKLTEVVMQAVRNGAANDPVALSELEQEATARQMHYRLLEFPVVSHLLRPDSPVESHELAAVILGESVEAADAILSMLQEDQIELLCQQAEKLVSEHDEQNIPGAPFARDILQNMRAHNRNTPCH